MKRVKVTFLTLVASLFMIGNVAAQTLEDAAAKYTAATEQYQAKQFDAAAKLLEEALTQATALGEEGSEILAAVQELLPDAYMNSGKMAAQKKQFPEAINAFLKAEEMAEKFENTKLKRQASRFCSIVYQTMGADAFNNKDFAKAIESFSKGMKQDPDNIKLAVLTAKSYAELDSLDLATTLYKQIIDAAANNSKFAEDAATSKTELVTYYLVAESKAVEAKDLNKAIELADKLSAVIPNEPQSSMMVIQLANNLKNYDVVIARGEAAAAAQTDEALKSDVYHMLGGAYQNKDNKAKAIEALRKVTAGNGVAPAKALITELSK